MCIRDRTTAGQLSLLDRYQNQIVALQEEMMSLRGQVAAECGYATDWSGVGSVNLRNMAMARNQLGQTTQELQCLPEATIVQAPALVASSCSVQSCAAVEPPVTSTTTTTRSIETTTPTRYEDTPKSSNLAEESRSTRAASSENRKRRTRSRQRSCRTEVVIQHLTVRARMNGTIKREKKKLSTGERRYLTFRQRG